jgi:hypothetical protein
MSEEAKNACKGKTKMSSVLNSVTWSHFQEDPSFLPSIYLGTYGTIHSIIRVLGVRGNAAVILKIAHVITY